MRSRLFSAPLNPEHRSGRETGSAQRSFRSPGAGSEPSAGRRHIVSRCKLLSLLLAAGAGKILHAGLHAAFHQAGMPSAGGAIGGDAGWNVHGNAAGHAALPGITDEVLHIHFHTLLIVAAAVLQSTLSGCGRPGLKSERNTCR